MSDNIDAYVNSFFKFGSECNFPGCDDLRKQYRIELATGLSGSGCHACYRMGLARRYKALITNRVTRGDTKNGCNK